MDTNGSISVQSFSIDLDDPRHGQEDSTGISFMHFDESKGGDTHKESDYDVVLSISIRRGTGYGMIRLNDKPSQQGWGYQDDFYYQKDWFRSKKPIFKVDLAQGSFRIYIDDLYIRDRSRRLAKPITHVQYWVKQSDLTTSALSHALTVAVP